MAKTEWSQDEPYNRLLPKAYVPVGEKVYFESYYPAGCGIIAGAQALAAVAPNIKIGDVDIDWNYLTAQPAIGYYGDSKSIKMVTTLIKDMYEKTESHPNYIEREYGRYEDTSIPTVGSSSTGSLELLNYLKNYVSCGQYYSKYAPDPLLTTPQFGLRASLFSPAYRPQRFFRPIFRSKNDCFTAIGLEK